MIGRHKFASGVADTTNPAIVNATDWNGDELIGWVLTNRTGGTLAAGDVVAIDAANDQSVVLADTQGAIRQYVVLVSALPSSSSHTPGTTINDTNLGIFLPTGVALVKVAGATTRGRYLRKSATAKALEDTGVAGSSLPPHGAIGVAIEGSGGAGTIKAIFYGLPRSSEAFPVGSVYIAVVGTDPATLLGYGTWTAIGAGRVLVGQDTGDTDFDTLEEVGGSKTQTTGLASATSTGGEGGASRTPDHTHIVSVLQPYLVVKMWKRTA